MCFRVYATFGSGRRPFPGRDCMCHIILLIWGHDRVLTFYVNILSVDINRGHAFFVRELSRIDLMPCSIVDVVVKLRLYFALLLHLLPMSVIHVSIGLLVNTQMCINVDGGFQILRNSSSKFEEDGEGSCPHYLFDFSVGLQSIHSLAGSHCKVVSFVGLIRLWEQSFFLWLVLTLRVHLKRDVDNVF